MRHETVLAAIGLVSLTSTIRCTSMVAMAESRQLLTDLRNTVITKELKMKKKVADSGRSVPRHIQSIVTE